MNKNNIVSDFLKLREEGIIKENFSTYNELLDVLSQMFSDEYDNLPDAQEAFNSLDNQLNGLLNKYYGVYSLGTKEWEILCSSEASNELINQSINEWDDYYNTKITNIDCICDSIASKVMDDMSNCGCDVHNALSMICDDVFSGENPFFVDCGEENPRISFLQ